MNHSKTVHQEPKDRDRQTAQPPLPKPTSNSFFHRLISTCKVHVNSKFSDKEDLVRGLPLLFQNNEGKLIHNGRNQLREFDWGDCTVVVKSYQIPKMINRLAYGFVRASKAERSYEYAHMLRSMGIGSPEPVAWMTERNGILFSKSYFVCIKSTCPYTYVDLIDGKISNKEPYLRAIAHTTALLHNKGIIHKDYSRGNILFEDTPDGINVEIIDLNRIRFHKYVSLQAGCKNFSERLPATPEMRRIMAEEYALHRGFDVQECYEQMLKGYDNRY